jgi:ATP/maltotriose-dependent transcriptional regulator MalT
MLDDVAARVTSPVLVGRADRLKSLDDALDRARHGNPATVLIGGEAGVGKSRFLAEFSDQAREAGARVLTAGCLELAQGGLPYTPFTTVLRELVREIGTDGVAELLGPRGTRELARLLPEFGTPGEPGGDTDPAEARARLFEQVLSLLEALGSSPGDTETRPVILVIEDLHWAPQSTRDLLAFLVGNQRAADGLLIIASYRSDELHRTHPLRPLLAELDRTDWVERTELPRLSRRDCTELVARILGREPGQSLADSVYQRTEGNPLFVEALLCCSGGLNRGLPESLHDLLAVSVQRLPEETQEVLRVASAAGERVGHALLAAVTGLGDDQLVAALRPAVAANVLITDAEDYTFRHALIREVVYDDLLPGENVRLHSRFAEVIGADPALVPPARVAIELAHHAYAAHDVTGALAAAWRAAQQAGQGLAPAEQVSLLSRVLELWDKVPEAAQLIGANHVGVLIEAARAAEDSWENDRTLALVSAALKEIEADAEPVRAAQLLEQRGITRYYLGRTREALADLREALAVVPEHPPTSVRAAVLRRIAWVLRDSSPDEALEAARESLAVARAAGDAKTEAQALMVMAVSRPDGGAGSAEEALEIIAQARAAANQAGYRPQLGVAISESHLLESLGQHEKAAAVAREAMARARAHGLARTDGSLLAVNVAEPLVSLGHWGEAAEVIEHALEFSPPPTLRDALRILAAQIELARGDLVSAAEYAALGSRLLGGRDYEAQFALPAVQMQAEVLVAQGQPADALPLIDDVLERYDPRLIPRYGWPVLVAGARACAAAGLAGMTARDRELSARTVAVAARLRALAEDTPVPGPMLEAYRLTFAAEAARGGNTAGSPAGGFAAAEQALTAWDEVAAAWDRVGQPYQRAGALLRAAEAALAGGDREAAEIRLLGAAQLADRLGARPLSEEIRVLGRRARIALAASGGRSRGRDAGQPAAGSGAAANGDGSYAGPPAGSRDAARDRLGLTEREFEVLRLVASGQSNREIGAQLFISTKTASVHVSNILGKLGASGRVEAAAKAHRLHLFDAVSVP